jgi:Domain of unknown function (DUF3883)
MSDDNRYGLDWSDEEVRLIVADYMAMLKLEIAGIPFNKSERRRNLMSTIKRTDGSIEFKHQNISAVFDLLGIEFIQGYKPAHNYQQLLVSIVEEFLSADTELITFVSATQPGFAEAPQIFLEAPPGRIDAIVPPSYLERLVRKFDPVERDFRNRELGEAGELLVYEREKSLLIAHDRIDLAKKVKWTSKEEGDGAGYDIRSYDLKGNERFIEVKTTIGSNRTPFFMTTNEKEFAEEARDRYRLHRVFDYRRSPRIYEMCPPLDSHVIFSASVYKASFEGT